MRLNENKMSTATETKDMLIFRKTTYRYEQGSKFAPFVDGFHSFPFG
jgi:hypothetical protein